MLEKASNLIAVILIYLFVMAKYIIFSTSIDLQFIIVNAFLLLIIAMKVGKLYISATNYTIAKFTGHIMYMTICFMISCNIIAFFYNIIFCYGFINTVVVMNALYSFNLAGIFGSMEVRYPCIERVKSQTSSWYSNFQGVVDSSSQLLKNIIAKYLWPSSKYVFYKLVEVNSELSSNDKSIKMHKQYSNKFTSGQNYCLQQMFQSQMPEFLSDNCYKYDLSFPYSNMENSFINATEISTDELDDFDSPENSPVNTDLKPIEPKQNTSQNREALKRKLAEKRAQRTGGSVNPPNINMQNFLNSNNIQKMMGEMMNNSTFTNMVNQIAQGEIDKMKK
jgi:hypothetical protein